MRMGLCRRYHRRKAERGTYVVFFMLLISILLMLCAYFFFCRVSPVFKARASAYASSIGTSTINSAINDLISEKGMTYSAFVNLEKDSENSITAIEGNTLSMNTFKSDVSAKIQDYIENVNEGTIFIPIGSLFNNEVLSGMGYRVPIKLAPVSITKVDFSDIFTSVGINQVKHSVCLNIDVTVSVVSSTMQISETVHTTVPVAETVIVGKVPNYYGQSVQPSVAVQ